MLDAAGTSRLLLHAWVVAAAVLAFALDRALVRAGRRVAHARAHATNLRRGALSTLMLGSARPLLIALRVGVWAGFVWLAGEISPSLRFARTFIAVVGHTAITAPVVMLGARDYSILDFLELPLAIAVAWLTVRYSARLLEMRLRRSGAVDAGMRDTIALLGRCLLGVAAALVILHAWGFDLSSLTIPAGVIGVGVGFGLQNITSNFVSGLLVSFERPIRPGDFIKVGELMGSVQRIGLRCTEVSTLDRVSILVPNSHFLEQEVINWSHGDPVYRLRVPVPVDYSANVATVRDALLEAASTHRAVLRDPAPRVHFRAFGASALEFDLLVWARDPKQQAALMSDMNYRIAASLRAHGIELSHPQLDVNVWERTAARTHDAQERTASRNGADKHDGLSGSALASKFDEVRDTRAWTDAEMDALLARMRGEGGIPTADRRFRFRMFRGCFVGSEAVNWLVSVLGVSREEAVEVGRALVARGSVHHVLHEHAFKDGYFFYRFRADEHEVTAARVAGRVTRKRNDRGVDLARSAVES